MAVSLGASVLRHGNPEQAVHGDAAGRARALHLVAQRANPVALHRGPCSVHAYFGAGKRVDNLGTENPRGGERARVDAELAGAAHHRGSRDMVLSRQTGVAPSSHFHVPAVED